MINTNLLAARLIEEGNKLHPIVKLADELFLAGLRCKDINVRMLNKKVPYEYSIIFRNRLRDLEESIKKVGEK
jgi:uncharacterized protein with PhoU and TrkA domain